MSKQYPILAAGEWERPTHRKYRFMCCDCALIHEMDFRIQDGKVEFRVWRDDRATSAARRGEETRKKLIGMGRRARGLDDRTRG